MTPRLHFFPDNVDTDLIMPGQFLTLTDPRELASRCMHGFDPAFASRVAPGDILVAGANFGCGSSREHAPLAIKALGVRCVIARSFARIFYRNAINLGLPAIACPRAVERIREGDAIEVDTQAGVIRNRTGKEDYGFARFPASIQAILSAGGIMNALRAG